MADTNPLKTNPESSVCLACGRDLRTPRPAPQPEVNADPKSARRRQPWWRFFSISPV